MTPFLRHLDYTPGTNSIELTWTNLSTTGTSIEIDRSTDGTTYSALTTTLDGSAVSYTDSSVSANTEYWYKIILTEPGGTITSDPLDTWTLPLAPTVLNVTSSIAGEVDLTWTNPGDSSTPFFIERSDDDGATFSIIDMTDAGATSYTDSSVTDGTNYIYQVDAVAGDGYNDNPVPVTATANVPLAAPTQLTVTPNGQTEMDLSWTNTSQTATGYTIERSTDGINFTRVGASDYADDTEYSDTTVSAGTEYYYRVKATAPSVDPSDPSNIAIAATDPSISISGNNTVTEGDVYTLTTTVIHAAGEVDPVKGWTIEWGDGSTTDWTADPGSFDHYYKTSNFYTITATTRDGSFTATQDVEVEYDDQQSLVLYAPDTSPDDGLPKATAGEDYTFLAAYSDIAGHHVNTWYVDWGDGTIDSFGGGSSTITTGAGLQSTDTLTADHTYADTPNGRTYPLVVTAVTDENIYQQQALMYANGDESFPDDSLNVSTVMLNPDGTLGDDPSHAVDDKPDVAMMINSEPAGEVSVDWGDGGTSSFYDDGTSPSISPGHVYDRSASYLVTITETPDGGGDAMVGHLFAGAGAVPIIQDPIPYQVVSAGSALDISPGITANSADIPMATIDFGEGLAPQVVPISDGSIDLSAVHVPSVITDPTHALGVRVMTYYAAEDVTGASDFYVYAWSAQIGNGEKNDLLIASPNGTENLQPVTFYFPHPAGEALNVTISSTDDSQDLLWDTPSPDPIADTPVVSPESPTYTFQTDPTQTSATFWTGATDGSTTFNVLKYEESATTNAADSTDDYNEAEEAGGPDAPGTVPSGAVVSNPVSDEGIKIELESNPNDGTGPADVTGNTEDWLVGQFVTLKAKVVGPTDNAAFHWTVAGHTLYQYRPSNQQATQAEVEDTNITYSEIPEFHIPERSAGLGHDELQFFWVTTTTGGASPESDTVTVTVNNVADIPLTVLTTFSVYTPMASFSVVRQGSPGVFKNPYFGQPYAVGLLGTWFTSPTSAKTPTTARSAGIVWSGTVSTPTQFSGGHWNLTQLTKEKSNEDFSDGTKVLTSITATAAGNDYDLDTAFPYGSGNSLGKGRILPELDGSYSPQYKGWPTDGAAPVELFDGPNRPLHLRVNLRGGVNEILQQFDNDYRTYVMYLPPGADSSWVPLLVEEWGVQATAVWVGITAPGNLSGFAPNPKWGNVKNIPGFVPATHEPTWERAAT